MNGRTLIACLALLTVTTTSCDLLKLKKTIQRRKSTAVASASAAPSGSAPAGSASSGHAAPSADALAHGDALKHGDASEGSSSGFALPFAWENSENEPLSKTREFLRETLIDNREYMKHGPKFFKTFERGQTPRATVVTCSDSRVQNAAWDLTPENDDFIVRNIGNQLPPSLGSVEYGVEHLSTPVLLILGHTGCGAVKAAMEDRSHLSPPIRKELETLVLPREFEGQSSDSAWTRAVVANVHAQVRIGLSQFASLVHEGRLTIVGAVYDFRNDLRLGAGRLTIVNVNGNSQQARLKAFIDAVNASAKSAPPLEPGAARPETRNNQRTEPDSSTATVEQVQKKLETLLNQQQSPQKSPRP